MLQRARQVEWSCKSYGCVSHGFVDHCAYMQYRSLLRGSTDLVLYFVPDFYPVASLRARASRITALPFFVFYGKIKQLPRG